MTIGRLLQAYRGGHRGATGWWVHIRFDEDVVAAIKTIPSGLRAWDEEKERWWISEEAEDELLRILPGLEAYRAQGSLL